MARDRDPGPRLLRSGLAALALLLRDDFVQAYGRELPTVVQCFTDDFDACIAHLQFPLRHRKVIRTTNVLERLFLEERPAHEDHPPGVRGASDGEAHVRRRDPRR